jgi:hypothetical protein
MPLWKCCASQMMPGAEEMHYPPVFTHCVDVVTRPVEAIQRPPKRLQIKSSSHPAPGFPYARYQVWPLGTRDIFEP